MMWASTPRHAAKRRIVPVFWGMSGSKIAIRIAEPDPSRRPAIMTEKLRR
jgi:hypothetical protein